MKNFKDKSPYVIICQESQLLHMPEYTLVFASICYEEDDYDFLSCVNNVKLKYLRKYSSESHRDIANYFLQVLEKENFKTDNVKFVWMIDEN